MYVVFKVDGNSLGPPGSPCGNGGDDQSALVPTQIILVPVAADGFTPKERGITILDRGPLDGPLIEAPSLARAFDGSYNLFFSSNCYNTKLYDVTWASASNVRGPYTKFGPLLRDGDFSLSAPGGATVAADYTHVAFHGNIDGSIEHGRAMYVMEIKGSHADLTFN